MLKRILPHILTVLGWLKSEYTTHLSVILVSAAYFANHTGALVKVLHSQEKADTVAGWCELIGFLGAAAGASLARVAQDKLKANS